eukprot:TRINITY_DN6872_c0_g1_i2.p1 TRINITY_DN6872_c0_g1~~TRINITY_DN6872_c0_g1_i2.p1  ORF type:complete len:218 (-),score=31.87 TRINITY_DN6872_c0_g1_i2:51-704(-)
MQVQPSKPGFYVIEDFLCTKNYGTGTIAAEKIFTLNENDKQFEFRCYNPFRSSQAASVLLGSPILVEPNKTVLLLGCSVLEASFMSDIVGAGGSVYAVEKELDVGHLLIKVSKDRPNIIPIVGSASEPSKFKMLVPMVDIIVVESTIENGVEVLTKNAELFLKDNGGALFFYKTKENEQDYINMVESFKQCGFSPKEKMSLEPYDLKTELLPMVFRE